MVDYFSLAITHGLLALAAFRLMLRADLDRDPDPLEAQSDGDSGPEPANAAARQGRKAARRA